MDSAAPGHLLAESGRGAAIRFRSVAKRYRAHAVLREVSFEAPRGCSTAIAGINGAGKSTLLRCLLDFCQPDQGQILIGDRDHTRVDARACLGWLPERFAAPAHLSARECLHWLAALRGAELDSARAEMLGRELGLDAKAWQTRAQKLSKGTMQKLGLMSIALSPCPVWVLDEPTSGLDPQGRQVFLRLLHAARQSGRTVLFTSHALRDVALLCDQLVVLHDGAVRFCGAPADLAARYENADLEAAFLACIEEGGGKPSAARSHAAQASQGVTQ